MSPRFQSSLGTFVILGAILWGVYIAMQNNFGFQQDAMHNNLVHVLVAKGPAELCLAGILIWVLAKWRDATKPR